MMKLVTVTLAMAAVAALAAPVDYTRVIKPILTENCYRCHGASQQKGEMRIDTAALALKGGDTGPGYVPGKSTDSLIVQAIKGTHDEISRMPYKKPPLSDVQIALIARWIDEGAKAPTDEQPESKVHWAFIKPTRPKLPEVSQKNWPRNSIDRFILARLEKENIKPSPEGDRVTLIRRLCLDLTGLPPSIAEVDAFVSDKSPDAYDKLVERLLSSPHYGERWGRHWLDVARYGDSNGYSIDAPRSIWKYRDWVINALNRDLPFDQFTIEQLAGDLLPNATLDQKIATGFNRNTQINQEGGIDPEQFRVESVMDRVNTTATAFLGLTVACAQCHDHKFDPISQQEYYQFYAFFNNTINDGHGKGAPEGMLEIPGEQEPTEALEKELEEAEADLDRYLDTKGSQVVKWEQALTDEEKSKLKSDVRDALKIPFSERSKKQKRTVYAAFRSDDAEFKQRNTKLARLERRQPKPITTLVMVEEKEPRESVIFIKGDFTRRGQKVTPGTPAVLHPLSRAADTASVTHADEISGARRSAFPSSGAAETKSLAVQNSQLGKGEGDTSDIKLTRLDLAKWITEPENPLTARVTVNRIWQQYFGKGLVETENDFGTQGIPPTHPELLDWLATELIHPSDKTAKPWSLKHIHRLIVSSATYRQSSKIRSDLANIDANNKLLARQNRLRLDSEIVRDVCLTASGLLTDKIGGPSVFPPQPAGVMTLGQVKREWKPSTGPDRYRRGMYSFFWRATPHPALTVFDSPDGFSTCTRRIRSNTPLQSLTLLNDDAFVEFSQAMAQRILKEPAASESDRIERAFRLCLSRAPSVDEKQRLLELLKTETAALEKSLISRTSTKAASETHASKTLSGGSHAFPSPGAAETKSLAVQNSQLGQGEGVSNSLQLAAWTTVSRVLLNLDETITRE